MTKVILKERSPQSSWLRWAPTFVGFPAGGYLASLVAGPIDSLSAALVGGLVTGAVVGTAQALAMPGTTRRRVGWAIATAIGTSFGLAVGSSAVGFETDTVRLMLMGAMAGAVVGVAQAAAADMQPLRRAAWAFATPLLWALGWLVTLQVIVDAERQHSMFGSSGAILVTAISGLILVWPRKGGRTRPEPAMDGSAHTAAVR